MGAHPDDYKLYGPPNSYIHVDHFASPAALAKYLHFLDKNDDEYNKYFKWRQSGKILGSNTFVGLIWCQLCKKLHEKITSQTIDFQEYGIEGKCLFNQSGKWYPTGTSQKDTMNKDD